MRAEKKYYIIEKSDHINNTSLDLKTETWT